MIYTGDFTKIDMHVHTRYTYGSTLSLKDVEKFLNKNIDFGLAITDINCISGAWMLQEKYPKRIIVGSQIVTKQGAITGLFLKENIPGGRDLSWTIDAILVQDGLVYIPHPMDSTRKTRLLPQSLALALKRCDIVEIFNSRTIRTDDNKQSIALLSANSLPACGSDAHTKQELGHTYVSMPLGAKLNAAGFYDALSQAELICKSASTFALMKTKFYTHYKRFTKKTGE